MKYNAFEHITLNEKTFSKQEILHLKISKQSHFKEVILFLKEWFSDTTKIEVQTSGSTGKPKKIKIPKQSFIESAINTCKYLKLTKKTNALLCIPVQYIGGKMMVIRALVGGYNLFVDEPCSNPLKLLNNSIDFIAITPMQAHYCFHESVEIFNSIKQVIIGGGSVSPTLLTNFQTLSNIIYSTYGMTETVSHIALRQLNGKNKTDFYTVLPAYSISQNQDDCLVINCPTLSKEKISTNDIVEINGNTFRFIGRKDNVINSGGIKIHPEEIEAILYPYLFFLEFMVSSIPDDILGNKLVLKIKKSNFLDSLPTLIFLNSKLEKHKTIKEIILINSFRYTQNGKLIRE